MREQISDAHRSTVALLEDTRTLIRGGDRDEVREALKRLGEVLHAHFEQEDSLYHSAVAVLRPDLRTSLHGLSEAHRKLRAQYAQITQRLELGALGATREAFEAFVGELRLHEEDEEHLLRSLEEPQR